MVPGELGRVLRGWGLTGGVCALPQHCIAEKVRTIRKYRSRPLCEYGGGGSRDTHSPGWAGARG